MENLNKLNIKFLSRSKHNIFIVDEWMLNTKHNITISRDIPYFELGENVALNNAFIFLLKLFPNKSEFSFLKVKEQIREVIGGQVVIRDNIYEKIELKKFLHFSSRHCFCFFFTFGSTICFIFFKCTCANKHFII